MSKSATSNSLLVPNVPLSGASAWRSGAAASGDVLQTNLLYLGPRVRKHIDHSQTAAELEQFQRELNPLTAGLAREMSAPFFEEQPGANFSGAVAFVGCKTGQVPHRSLPLGALLQLATLESFGRAHPEVAPFALVGLETANRGLIKSAGNQNEILCRFAFQVLRFIESRPSLFSRVTPVLDCEVLCSSDALNFSRKRKELDVWDPDRVATAVKALGLSTSGIQLKVGASNFGSRREIENAKRLASRDQMHLFLGQTLAEDEQLKGDMAFLYASGPASRRLGQLVLSHDEIRSADWLKVDHLTVPEAEFRVALAEHDQIDGLYRLVSELDPTLSIVDESLAWSLDCSKRMLDLHDVQLFEISTAAAGKAGNSKAGVSERVLENLKRDYSRAMRTYLRDLAARNFDWLLTFSKQLGFQVGTPSAPHRAVSSGIATRNAA